MATSNPDDESSSSEKAPNGKAAPPKSPFFVNDDNSPTNSAPSENWKAFISHASNTRDVKIWIRCSVAIWVASILIFINPVLQNFGQATFFSCIFLFIAPPAGILFVNILTGVTAALGMCLAWAWGAITMKAALATRSTLETNTLLRNLAQQNVREARNNRQASGQSTYTSILIYNGFALDTRVVVTFLFMEGLFVYLLARLRVAAPKLILTEIFGLIITDIFLTVGPLLPTFMGSIPQLLVKPGLTGVGLSIASSLIFFPESTSHAALHGFQGVLAPTKGFVEACLQSFEHHPVQFNVGKLEATKAQVLGAYKALQANLGFLPLDWSVGRWSAEDIASLKEPTERVITMFLGLMQLQVSRSRRLETFKRLENVRHTLEKEGSIDYEQLPRHGHVQLLDSMRFSDRVALDESKTLWDKNMQTLAESSGDILRISMKAINVILEAMRSVNERRWYRRPSPPELDALRGKHKDVLRKLKYERKTFATKNTEHLLGHHFHLFNEDGQLRIFDDPVASPVRGLLLALVFEERILSLADAIHDMLEKIVQLGEERTTTRLWAPLGLRHALPWVFGKDPAPAGAASGATQTPTNELDSSLTREATKNQGQTQAKKDKGSDENSAAHQLKLLRVHSGRERTGISKLLIKTIDWLTNTEGQYALRILTVTIALTLPAVIKHSAGFFYRERGIWALIMSQTGLLLYSADFIIGFLLRTAGTIIGGVLGMVCWYIGSGSGPGNSYGMGAVMAVAVVLLVYCRLFAPPSLVQGVMLGAATLYLVVGYSWSDTHVPSYGRPGVGYSVFWRRTLLVIIGFTAGAIVTFFPKPPSATRDVANTLARNLRRIKDLHALFLTTFHAPPADLKRVVEKTTLVAAEAIDALGPRVPTLKYEFTSTNLDPQTLSQVIKHSVALNQSIAQLFTYATSLPPDLKMRFAHFCVVQDTRLAGDIMAVLSLLEQALKTGDPLPAVLPTPLMGRMIDYVSAQKSEYALSLDAIREENFRKYCAALNAWVAFLTAIDDCVLVLKEALGEEHVVSAWEGRLGREEA